MADKPEPLPRRHQPTVWSYAIVEICRCGAEIHRPSEVQRATPVVCGTCRALRVMTIIASRHALIIGAVLLLQAGCATVCHTPDQQVPHAYGPAIEHEPGYAPPYEPYDRGCNDENSLACFKYHLEQRT